MLPNIGATAAARHTAALDLPVRATVGPKPFDASGCLAKESLDWINAQALEPSRTVKSSSSVVSAGLFTYFNAGNAALADRYFHQVRLAAATGFRVALDMTEVVGALDGDGMHPQADVFLRWHDPKANRVDFAREDYRNSRLLDTFGHAVVREQPLAGGALLKSKLEALQPGQCALLSIDDHNVIAVLRDSEQLWVFDTGLNPDRDDRSLRNQDVGAMFRMAPHRFVGGACGGLYTKCVNGEAAQKLLDAWIRECRTQPVLVTPQPAAPGAPSTA